MALPDVLKSLLDEMKHIAKTETVFGEPITAGDVTLVPVSKVSVGFAAGGSDKEGSKSNRSGTGGGIQVTPLAFISIKGDKIQVHSVEKTTSDLDKILSLAPDVLSKILKTSGKKKNKK